LVISNHNSFRVLFDRIDSLYISWKIHLYFSIGNGQPREPALCQLYRRTFVLCPKVRGYQPEINIVYTGDNASCLMMSVLTSWTLIAANKPMHFLANLPENYCCRHLISRRRNFVYNAQHSLNVVVRNLATAMLYLYCVLLFFFVLCTYLYPVYIYRVFSVNKGFQ